MKNIFKKSFLILLFLSVYSSSSYALEVETHKAINKYIAQNTLNSFSLDSYLKNILGLTNGKEEELTSNKTRKVFEWLELGGEFEDKPPENIIPYRRSRNHFHNPLLPWDQAHYTGTFSFCSVLDNPFLIFGHCPLSAILWAQGQQNSDLTLLGIELNPGGDWSWKKVREYYYTALTGKDLNGNLIAADKMQRDTYFANTFRGMGHLMHLVQDMSVPEHTRNDFHTFGGYEGWVADPKNVNISTIGSIPFSGDINSISSFFDTDQYNGNNPDVTASSAIGLSEYTNANFVSPQTRFNKFPYPSKNTSVQIVDYDFQDPFNLGVYVKRQYYKKVADGERGLDTNGDGTPDGYRLAGVDYLNFYRDAILSPTQDDQILTIPPMDDNVYSDYASLLLPRAVGYSSGLLNYFFRGGIDMTEVSPDLYKIKNSSNEEMAGTTSSFKLFYDDAGDNRYEIALSFFDELGNEIIDTTLPLIIAVQRSSSFTVRFQPPSAEPKQFILVFKGRLGSEEEAVIGKVSPGGKLYLVMMPVDHTTRESLPKQFYSFNALGRGILNPIAKTDIPFGLLDDGGYWDSITTSWTKKENPEGLGIPIGTGGPQYLAKYRDAANNRVRFILNTSYEKEAYHPFKLTLTSPDTGQPLKTFNYLTFIGSPLTSFGMYNENTGWMEYTNTGVMAIQSPPPSNPQERFFPLYKGGNFNDTFIHTPAFRFYGFDGSTSEINIPQDPEAPMPSIVSAYKLNVGYDIEISVPKIFPYVKPNPAWPSSSDIGSSGVDYYKITPNQPSLYLSSQNKCTTEDNNCGYTYEGSSTVNAGYDIPYNFNSKVRVYNQSPFYEELYINGKLVETSPASTEKLAVHYQILAVYKDTAVIRKTEYKGMNETPLPYRYGSISNPYRIYERVWNFTSNYFVCINGNIYNLTGTTDIKSRYLTVPYPEPPLPADSLVNYLTFEPADDITGYHIDRIFISKSFDGGHILVSFDEYAYNGGKGLVHQMKYELAEDSRNILFYDIPPNEIQNADHEGLRTGRKILLFRNDGTLKTALQDPVGLEFSMGSAGILN